MKQSSRHKWGEPVRFVHKTERSCARCPVVRVTRHEVDGTKDVHWVEFWRDGDKVEGDATPPCDASLVVPA